MKTIPALLDAVPSVNLSITEHGDQTRLRAPVLALESDGAVLAYASAWGGPKRRQEAERALTLFKLLVEREATDTPSVEAVSPPVVDTSELDALKAQVAELQEALEAAEAENVVGDDAGKFAAALDEILSADVTSAKRAKEIAAAVRS